MKIKSLIKHNLMRAAMTLALILACAAAWADNVSTYYIDENGTRHDVTATVLTGNEIYIGTSNQTKWYVVNSNINYSSSLNCYGNVNIILADNKTMTVNSSTINAVDLTIYGQSEQSGSLNVSNPPSYVSGAIYCYPGSFIINGGTVNANADGSMKAIYCDLGNFIINCGTVNATNTSTSTGSGGIYANYVTINGGNVTANGRVGIFAFDITLGWRKTTDYVYANSYSGTVKVKDSQAFKDSNGNIYVGTLNNSQINGKTLTPATQTEYIQYCLGTGNDGSAEHPYTISDANGWNAFCLALDDNTTYNHFSGKTVKLGANITVSRMAGSTGFQNYHPFCGTFDGNHKTITFNKGTANSPESDHSALFAATEASDQFTGSNETVVVIKDLTVDGTIYTSSDCAAGLVGSASARLTITGCQSNITIHTSSQYAAGFVSSSSGILNITDCVSSATIISSYNGNGYHGGFIGKSSLSTNTITGCLFTGKLLTTNNTQNCGGFIGWYSPNQSSSNWSNDIIVNSICKPAPLESGETAITSGSPFVCWNPEDATNKPKITNSYYFEASVPNTQLLGKAAHSIAAGHDVTMSIVGTPNQYNLSSITYFDTSTQYFTLQNECLQFANELYAGLDDAVSITLEHPETPEGYLFEGYSPAENLSGSGNDYTLTMPDEDVVITAPQSSIHYNITYHLNGGAMPTGVSNPSTYTIEDDDITLNNPEKEDYIFGGWYKNESFLYGVVTTIAHGSTGNKELYARWGSGVPYIDADGSLQHHECVELTGNETDNLAEGWYVVRNTNPNGVDLTYTNGLICQGDLNLILCDGAEVHFNDGLLANGTFTIYGQSEGTGTLIASSSSSALSASSYNGIIINGGIINATCTAEDFDPYYDDIAAIKAGRNITINRGIVNANGGQAPAASTTGKAAIP